MCECVEFKANIKSKLTLFILLMHKTALIVVKSSLHIISLKKKNIELVVLKQNVIICYFSLKQLFFSADVTLVV